MRLSKIIIVGDLIYRLVVIPPTGKLPRHELKGPQDGLTDYDRGRIYVYDYGRNPSRLVSTVIHELFHAALAASGCTRILRAYAKQNKLDEVEVEESFISALSPVMVTAMRTAGLLKGSWKEREDT